MTRRVSFSLPFVSRPSRLLRHPSPVTRDSLVLFLLALAVNSAVAFFVSQPGYMDAYYYFGGALRLSQGFGFTEPYLWNYLDSPAGLPHPSHLYWPPLTSIVAATSMAAFGQTFRAAQLPFIGLASLLPVMSYWLADRLAGNRRHAWIAGLLFVFCGFYLPFLPNTDAFALYTLLGAGSLLATAHATESPHPTLCLCLGGLLAGLASLTRADGALLALACLAWLAARSFSLRRLSPSFFLSFAFPFFLVLAPWWLRNALAVGTPFPPGGLRAAWLMDYNELFSFPAEELTLARYLGQGWAGVFHGKLNGLGANLQTAIAVQGSVFLLPFILIGLWRARFRPEYRLALLYYAGLFGLMTFVFTFPGVRGGFFHSGMALLPFFVSVVPLGLDASVEWAAARRKSWDARVAKRVFSVGLVLLAVGLSMGLTLSKMIGKDWRRPAWDRLDTAYVQVGDWMTAQASPDAIVLVNNPPGFFYHTGRRAIVIPDGGIETLLVVADRYGAGYLLLDANHPDGLRGLYVGQAGASRLRPVAGFSGDGGLPVYLFEVLPDG